MYEQYIVFKGLQKPLEFLGIRGRFLIYAAVAIGCSFLGCMVVAIIFNMFVGLGALVVFAGAGAAYIFLKQKRGLHDKRIDKGIFIYHYIFKRD